MKLIAIGAGIVVVLFIREILAGFRRERRRAIERRLFATASTFVGRGGARCNRCGEPISHGDLVVAGPPSAEGPEVWHARCGEIIGRASGLPGDKRSRASYDRDTERLLTLFAPELERKPNAAGGSESWDGSRSPIASRRPSSNV